MAPPTSGSAAPVHKRLILANPRGFCAGVERAITAVEDAVDYYGAPVFVRRHIVHNQAVVDRLEVLGAKFVAELDEVPEGAVAILSAHGVSPVIHRAARHRKLRTVDTTCPLVARVHAQVVDYYRTGRHILLIGQQGHPQILATVGQVPAGAISVIGSVADLDALPLAANTAVALSVQTTFSVGEAAELVSAIKRRFLDVAAPSSSDICFATTNRQEAIGRLASAADQVVVVGDALSSNARRLADASRAAGCRIVHLVNGPDALDIPQIAKANVVALTAAASTPAEQVRAVCDHLVSLGFVVEESQGREESTKFAPVAIAPSDDLPLADRMETVRRDVERCLDRTLAAKAGRHTRLIEAMRYAVLGGGKRLRASLTVLAAEMLEADYRRAIWVASAIECLHAQSLVHDDLPCMDDDDLRRGRPSLHRQFDEATAVLAGDALLALAFEMLSDERAHPDGAIRARLVNLLARTVGKDGLALGQMMDLNPLEDSSPDDVEQCEVLKTGVLLNFCVEAAALLADCSAEERQRLIRFSQQLGLAFQIRDDILDRIGNAQEMGKRTRKDRRSGRITAIEALGLEGAHERSRSLAAACQDHLAAFGPRAEPLRQIAEFAVSRMH